METMNNLQVHLKTPTPRQLKVQLLPEPEGVLGKARCLIARQHEFLLHPDLGIGGTPRVMEALKARSAEHQQRIHLAG